jgi:hypothetical protein
VRKDRSYGLTGGGDRSQGGVDSPGGVGRFQHQRFAKSQTSRRYVKCGELDCLVQRDGDASGTGGQEVHRSIGGVVGQAIDIIEQVVYAPLCGELFVFPQFAAGCTTDESFHFVQRIADNPEISGRVLHQRDGVGDVSGVLRYRGFLGVELVLLVGFACRTCCCVCRLYPNRADAPWRWVVATVSCETRFQACQGADINS